MRERRSLIFWMGGLVTPSLLEGCNNALEEMGQTGINLPAIPGFEQLSEKLALGQIDDLQFFNEIFAAGKISLDAGDILPKVKERMLPDPRTLAAINLLPAKYQRWLICEFPQDWYEQISKKHGLNGIFNDDHVIFLSKTGLERITPEIFDFLPERVGDTLENCLYFDRDPKRVIAAINRTFPAVIYVDPTRLEREFVMRNFIDRHQPVHTPPVTL